MSKQRANESIPATRVILIAADGTNRGEFSKFAAITIARQEGLDLVEVKSGVVPTFKIADWSKVQYERSKADKNKGTHHPLKEIRFNYNTGDHDLAIKKKKITEFLAKGHKVLCGMNVHGRERFVNQGAAKEKFLTVVREFTPTIAPDDISENEKGFNVTLHPTQK